MLGYEVCFADVILFQPGLDLLPDPKFPGDQDWKGSLQGGPGGSPGRQPLLSGRHVTPRDHHLSER